MLVTNTTANYGFQLPNGANELKDDILRLINAIVAIDANEAAIAAILAGKAPLNAPVFINPQGTTQAGSDNSTKLATTAFVKSALAALVGSSPATLDTLNELATALGNDPNFATTITNALATKANAATTYSKTEVDNKVILAGLRNKVINHRFDVLQRSTALTTGPNYVTDRWQVFTFGAGATGANAAVLNNPNSYAIGHKNLLVFERTGGTSLGLLRHAIEGVETLAGKTITIALYAYATANTTVALYLNQVFGTGGSPSAAVFNGTATFNITTTPTIFYYKMTLASIAGKTLGTNNNDYLVLHLETPTTGAFALRILDVAVVEGDATGDPDPFGNRGLQAETGWCQRYYNKLSVPAEYTQSISASLIYRGYQLAVPMRAAPAYATIATPLSFNSTGGTGAAFSTFGAALGNASQVTVLGAAAAISGWQAGGVIGLDAELI